MTDVLLDIWMQKGHQSVVEIYGWLSSNPLSSTPPPDEWRRERGEERHLDWQVESPPHHLAGCLRWLSGWLTRRIDNLQSKYVISTLPAYFYPSLRNSSEINSIIVALYFNFCPIYFGDGSFLKSFISNIVTFIDQWVCIAGYQNSWIEM